MKKGKLQFSDFIYNLLINAGLPLVPILLYRGFKQRNPGEVIRRKFNPPGDLNPAKIWLHGASVGEIKQVNMIAGWLQEFGVPAADIVVSAQTLTGLDAIEHRRKFFMPLDYSWLLKPLCEQLAVKHLFVVETELWPNLYRYHDGEVTVFNGKIKEKTYSRYRLIKPLFSTVLSRCRQIFARTAADRERFENLGCRPEIIRETGSLKWLQLLEDPPVERTGPCFAGDREVIVAGSTHPGEEELALRLLEEKNRGIYLAPRHLERVDEVARLIEEAEFDWCLWSESSGQFSGDVILIDEMGLLPGVYGRGDLAFVGGSWREEVGGHNLLEPAVHSLPVVTGPHLDNVREIAEVLVDKGLLIRVEDKKQWPKKVEAALELPGEERNDIYRVLEDKARKIKKDYFSYLEEISTELYD
ncbi:MAG: 3-deoxy-D-manno-octulosonic acid transferase [bacterium]